MMKRLGLFLAMCLAFWSHAQPLFIPNQGQWPKIYFGHATTQNLNANEIQTITTLVPPIHEFPVIHIHTLATPRAEVQAITVSPPTVMLQLIRHAVLH